VGWITSAALTVFGAIKWGALLIAKVGALKTLLTLMISFGAYAWLRGPEFAAGLVIMILIHEMGHVYEIRRQGMQASAPLFIPFLGAAIFQKQHPTDALKQAQIGIAGPIAGTLGATASWVLYGATHYTFFLDWALIGFLINLFNLIPIGMLDGGWILAAVSKWFQVVGLVLLGAAVYQFHLYFSPIVILIVILAIPMIIERFRNDNSAYYKAVPHVARWAMGGAWLGLVVYLAVSLAQISGFLGLLHG
jgi:Zn-dependent protease